MTGLMEKLSPRGIRFLYSAFALLVLCIAIYNLLHVLLWRVPSNDQCEWRQSWSDSAAVHIDWMEKKSTALKMGFDRGDVILEINAQPVVTVSAAEALLLGAKHGEKLDVVVDRDGRHRSIAFVRDTAQEELPFLLYEYPVESLVITNIVPDGVTERAGAQDGDILRRIDGISTRIRRGPQYLLNLHPAGSVARFTIERDGEFHTLDVHVLKTFNYPYLGLFLLGLGFLIVAYVVVMARPEGKIQRKFGRYGILSLLVFSLQDLTIGTAYDSMTKVYIMLALVYVARIFAPPVFISFFFHFPFRKRIADKRWVMIALYFVCILSVALHAVLTFHLLDISVPSWLLHVSHQLPLWYFFAGLIVFLHSYFKLADKIQRKQLRPIVHSTVIGIVAFVYISIISTTYPLAIFLQPYLLLPTLLFIGIPPAFGYAIFKHRLMDVTVIVRRSIIYGLITAAIAAIYLIFVFGLGNLLGLMLGETDNKLLILFAFIVIALVFDPLKKRLQDWVDRIFYQERYNYQKALLEFSRELPRQIKLEEILSSMVSRISSTMHVERVAVGLCDDAHGCHVVSKNISERCCEFGHQNGGLLQALKDMRCPISCALIDEDTLIVDEGDRDRIREAGIVLVVPMFLQDRLIGAINVGAKMSGKVYSQEDIDLLSTVASQAAIAIENARLHASELEKQKITEQLRLAQRIQQGLLPSRNPVVDHLDISGISIPAMTVGGDYYDYIQLPDNRLLVVVGDVSGKGISAALYMSKVQGILRFAAQVSATPREMLISTNRHLYEGMERSSFITVILALFDLNNNTVTICRGGHTHPLIGMNGDLRYMEMDGMGLGLEQGTIFDNSLQEKTWDLKKNGTILLYSDGLTEAMDANMNLFGEERVYDLVKNCPEGEAFDLQQRILDEVALHRGNAEQNDDITLVVIRVRPE